MYGLGNVRTKQIVTTINQAMGVRGYCEGPKQLLQQAERRCDILVEIQGMFKMRE